MNAPFLHRAIVKRHVATLEAGFPIKVLGVLPRGSAAHIDDPAALDILAEKKPGPDLLGLCEAEVQLGDWLGRPVGIVLSRGLTGSDVKTFSKVVEPL